MKYLPLALILILSFVIGYQNFPVDYKRMQKSTVHVVMKDGERTVGHCSGVYLGEGEILTAGHCKKDKDVFVRLYGTEELVPAEFIKTDFEKNDGHPAKDLALLKTKNLDIPSVTVRCDRLTVGTELYAVGMPREFQWTVTQGTVTTTIPRPDFKEGHWLQMNVTILPGNSGGPVFDRWGNLVGIISHAWLDSEHTYAVSGQMICDFINGDD